MSRKGKLGKAKVKKLYASESFYSQLYPREFPENDPYIIVHGFGVRPDTSDPTVVKIIERDHKPWQVEVFTLSSGVWNAISCSNLPTQAIKLELMSHVVIDRFIYWAAYNPIVDYHEKIVVSFDLVKREFKLVDLPDILKYKPYGRLSVSKLRESLVVYGSNYVEGAKESCDVWVMQHDSSFEKLFSIRVKVEQIFGFTESGDAILQTLKDDKVFSTLDVYDPCSQQINNLGIVGGSGTFGMGSYKESLLLLDHPDLHIYFNDN